MNKPKRIVSNLAKKEIAPSRDNISPLKGDALTKLQEELGGGWTVVEQHHLEKEYEFEDFRQALDFTNKVGELAESLSHHPDIYLSWGKVRITIWTHKINSLSEGDFVFAAKVDMLHESE